MREGLEGPPAWVSSPRCHPCCGVTRVHGDGAGVSAGPHRSEGHALARSLPAPQVTP